MSNNSIKLSSPSTATQVSSSSWPYLSAITLGLLSSSCCIIQLVLNAFSIGCAGFSILTPYRPMFSSISLLMILYTIYKYRFSKRTAITLTITLILSASPELVSVHNQAGLQPYYGDSFLVRPMLPLFQLIKQYPILTTGNEYETGNTKKSDKVEQLALTPLIKYDIRVEGMACEACGSRLRQYFASRKDIEKVKVYFSEKRLEFWSRSGLGALAFTEQNIQDMIAEVDTKYTAKIIGVYSETKE